MKIDPIQETLIVPAPELCQIPATEHIMVEEPPQPESTSANVELPANHDPLDGLTEPKVPTNVFAITPLEEYNHQSPPNLTQHFPDGEVDLLGSLERALEKRG